MAFSVMGGALCPRGSQRQTVTQTEPQAISFEYLQMGDTIFDGVKKVRRCILSTDLGKVDAVVKLIPKRRNGIELNWRSAIDEARIGFALKHDRLVRCLRVAETDDDYGIIMEAMDTSLDRVLDRFRKTGARFTSEQAISILTEAADGLSYMSEKGVLHNDLYARNIFVDESAGAFTVKIADFGLVQVTKGNDKPDLSADVEAFGVIINEIMALTEDMPANRMDASLINDLANRCANPAQRPDMMRVYQELLLFHRVLVRKPYESCACVSNSIRHLRNIKEVRYLMISLDAASSESVMNWTKPSTLTSAPIQLDIPLLPNGVPRIIAAISNVKLSSIVLSEGKKLNKLYAVAIQKFITGSNVQGLILNGGNDLGKYVSQFGSVLKKLDEWDGFKIKKVLVLFENQTGKKTKLESVSKELKLEERVSRIFEIDYATGKNLYEGVHWLLSI